MMRRIDHNWNFWRKAGAVVLVGSMAVAGAFVGVSVASASSDAYVDLGLLDRKITSFDELPEPIEPSDLGVEGLISERSRLIRDDATATYWAAIDRNGYLCILVYLKGEDWVAGTGCSKPSDFNSNGVNIRIANPSLVIEAYLIPDRFVAEFQEVIRHDFPSSENMIILDPYASKEERLVLLGKIAKLGFEWRIFPEPISVAGI